MIALTRKQRAHVILHNAAAAAGGIGAGWVSELVLVPDAVPLSLVQALMLVALLRVFEIRLIKAVLSACVAAFCTTLIGRGLALLLFTWFAEHEILINIAVAVIMTEALGLSALRVCQSMMRRSAPTSWVTAVVRATRRERFRALLASVPMLVAGVAAFAVIGTRKQAEVRLRAPAAEAFLHIDHPLVERHQGLLQLSGQPRGQSRRVVFVVHNDVLVEQLERQVFRAAPPQVMVDAWVPAAEVGSYSIEPGWQTEIALGSNYWRLVRGRLHLLLVGLLCTLAIAWLGAHRDDPPPAGPDRPSRPS